MTSALPASASAGECGEAFYYLNLLKWELLLQVWECAFHFSLESDECASTSPLNSRTSADRGWRSSVLCDITSSSRQKTLGTKRQIYNSLRPKSRITAVTRATRF